MKQMCSYMGTEAENIVLENGEVKENSSEWSYTSTMWSYNNWFKNVY